MDYIEWNINLKPVEPWSEITVALLGEAGFDSFVNTESGVQAYIPADQHEGLEDLKKQLIATLEAQEVSCVVEENRIPHQNWNATWEESFEPVFVEDDLCIRAPFHSPSQQTKMELVIQPQMSFGTGHHQTTWMMCKAILEMNPQPEKVLDMGSGTGVLAILSKKLGAKTVWGIDIEAGAVENAIENAERNECKDIRFDEGNVELITDENAYDAIFANINKNVLKAHMSTYFKALKPSGKLLLSGFFESDVEELLIAAKELGGEQMKIYTRESWAAILLQKK